MSRAAAARNSAHEPLAPPVSAGANYFFGLLRAPGPACKTARPIHIAPGELANKQAGAQIKLCLPVNDNSTAQDNDNELTTTDHRLPADAAACGAPLAGQH